MGTNRYSYSSNDPVNLMDPGGNCIEDACILEAAFVYSLAQAAIDAFTVAAILESTKHPTRGIGDNGGPPLDDDQGSKGPPPPLKPGTIVGLTAAAATSKLVSGSDPVSFAQNQQGSEIYPGVDSYYATTLEPGQLVYQLGNGTVLGSSIGPFFDATGEAFLTAPSGASASGDVQVRIHPEYGPYKGYTTYQVTRETPAAIGEVSANTQYGPGGATQVVIDVAKYGENLQPLSYTKFPN